MDVSQAISYTAESYLTTYTFSSLKMKNQSENRPVLEQTNHRTIRA
jgi:hypothetical protein